MTAPALVMCASYLLGALPFAYVLPRYLGGVDVRTAGSGNVGAANVFRTTKLTTALMVIALDMGKGALAVSAAAWAGVGREWQAAAGVAAVLGHVYSVWLRFDGGKGVATACGVFAVLAPAATVAALSVFVLTVAVTRYVSAGSLAAVFGLVGGAWAAGADRSARAACVAVGLLVIWKHRANIARLVAGRERRLGERA